MILCSIICVLCKYAICSNSQIASCEISDLASFVSNESGYILHQNVSLDSEFKLILKFKTLVPNGMIFYVTNRAQTAALSLSLVEGALVLISQKHELKVPLLTKYNDGEWHVVSVIYNEKQPSLEIDDWEAFTIESLSAPLPLHIVNGDLFIGGFRDDYKPPNGTINITTSFSGCLADVILNNKTINFANAAKKSNVVLDRCVLAPNDHVDSLCQKNTSTELGMYFGTNTGYVQLKRYFKVGVEIDIEMDIKPRNESGLLLSVYGSNDFLVLQMLNGVLHFTVDNGKGRFETNFIPPTENYFCDGNWHNIRAIKSKNVLTVAVDMVFANPAIGSQNSYSTDTKSRLCIGGNRLLSAPRLMRGMKTHSFFVGCMRNVKINSEIMNISSDMATGDVSIGLCPTN